MLRRGGFCILSFMYYLSHDLMHLVLKHPKILHDLFNVYRLRSLPALLGQPKLEHARDAAQISIHFG